MSHHTPTPLAYFLTNVLILQIAWPLKIMQVVLQIFERFIHTTLTVFPFDLEGCVSCDEAPFMIDGLQEKSEYEMKE